MITAESNYPTGIQSSVKLNWMKVIVVLRRKYVTLLIKYAHWVNNRGAQQLYLLSISRSFMFDLDVIINIYGVQTGWRKVSERSSSEEHSLKVLLQ